MFAYEMVWPGVEWPARFAAEFPEQWYRAARKALRGWHKEMLPEHFKFGAYKKYGYHLRPKKYEITKARVKKHRNPLVFSGRLQNLASERISVRRGKPFRTSGGLMRVTGSVKVPKYMTYKQSKEEREEILAVATSERERLSEVITADLNKRLKRLLRKAAKDDAAAAAARSSERAAGIPLRVGGGGAVAPSRG